MNKKKDRFVQIVDLKLSKKLKGKQEKKDGVVWIVDLKLSKKLKGKQEKKDVVAKLWIWIYIEKKMGLRQSCVFEW